MIKYYPWKCFLFICVIIALGYIYIGHKYSNCNYNFKIVSFVCGFLVLIVFSVIVFYIICCLRQKGDILEDFEKEQQSKSIGLSTRIAVIEQFLFYIAAIAGKEVFGDAIMGWLVFKGIHQWARWGSAHNMTLSYEEENQVERACKLGFSSLEHYRECLDRNRFMVFLIGTGMSIAAGGIAGAVYNYISANHEILNCLLVRHYYLW
ncbi:MAG: hypothetical protein ACE5EA_07695 [Nitrospirota bacterium]